MRRSPSWLVGGASALPNSRHGDMDCLYTTKFMYCGFKKLEVTSTGLVCGAPWHSFPGSSAPADRRVAQAWERDDYDEGLQIVFGVFVILTFSRGLNVIC